MDKKILGSVLAAIALALLAVSNYSEHQKNLELQRQTAELRLRMQESEREALSLESRFDKLRASLPATTPTIAPEHLKPVRNPPEKPAAEEGDHAEWQARYLVSQIERHLALSDSEQKRLTEHFRSGKGIETLAEVLGGERAAEFEAERAKAEAQSEEEDIQTELFRLSRKLNLTPPQEQQLELTLRTVHEADRAAYANIRSQTDRAMALHTEPQSDGSDLRAIYDQIRITNQTLREHEKQRLTEQLQGTLSDEQLNRLLEDEK